MLNDHDNENSEQVTIEALFQKYASTRDSYTRHQIISRNLNLVKPVVRKFLHSSESYHDMLQVGYIGLIKAVDLFDVTRNVRFSTFATRWIEGEIRHHIRDKAESIKKPRWLVELTGKVNRYTEKYEHEHHRLPGIDEISSALNIAPAGIVEIMKCREAGRPGSLDDQDAGEIDRGRIRSVKRETFKLPIEDRIALEEAISHLQNAERKIIYSIFYYDLTQMQIAKKLGISQKKVSRVLQKALDTMKRMLQK